MNPKPRQSNSEILLKALFENYETHLKAIVDKRKFEIENENELMILNQSITNKVCLFRFRVGIKNFS